MSSFGPCFREESKLKEKKDICPDNAECFNGICVCQRYYYKDETGCVGMSNNQRNNKHHKQQVSGNINGQLSPRNDEAFTETHLTTLVTLAKSFDSSNQATANTPITTASSIKSQTTESGHYIRGVYLSSKNNAQFSPESSTPRALSTPLSYTSGIILKSITSPSYTPRPWQMRSRILSNSNNRHKRFVGIV